MCKQIELNLPTEVIKSMKGQHCLTNWCRGKYAEVSINNDWDGTVNWRI
jgi:hypothetical protein